MSNAPQTHWPPGHRGGEGPLGPSQAALCPHWFRPWEGEPGSDRFSQWQEGIGQAGIPHISGTGMSRVSLYIE